MVKKLGLLFLIGFVSCVMAEGQSAYSSRSKRLDRIQSLFSRLRGMKKQQQDEQRNSNFNSTEAVLMSDDFGESKQPDANPKVADDYPGSKVEPVKSSYKLQNYLGSEGLRKPRTLEDMPKVELDDLDYRAQKQEVDKVKQQETVTRETPSTIKSESPVSSIPAKPDKVETVVSAVVPRSGGAPDEVDYIVKPGDSLLLIARKVYRDPQKYKLIMQWNELKSETLHPNQRLLLKAVPWKIRTQWKREATRQKADLYPPEKYRYRVYKVQSGDSLSRLAQKFLGSQSQYLKLAQFNDISARKFLFVGQKLVIPELKQN